MDPEEGGDLPEASDDEAGPDGDTFEDDGFADVESAPESLLPRTAGGAVDAVQGADERGGPLPSSLLQGEPLLCGSYLATAEEARQLRESMRGGSGSGLLPQLAWQEGASGSAGLASGSLPRGPPVEYRGPLKLPLRESSRARLHGAARQVAASVAAPVGLGSSGAGGGGGAAAWGVDRQDSGFGGYSDDDDFMEESEVLSPGALHHHIPPNGHRSFGASGNVYGAPGSYGGGGAPLVPEASEAYSQHWEPEEENSYTGGGRGGGGGGGGGFGGGGPYEQPSSGIKMTYREYQEMAAAAQKRMAGGVPLDRPMTPLRLSSELRGQGGGWGGGGGMGTHAGQQPQASSSQPPRPLYRPQHSKPPPRAAAPAPLAPPVDRVAAQADRAATKLRAKMANGGLALDAIEDSADLDGGPLSNATPTLPNIPLTSTVDLRNEYMGAFGAKRELPRSPMSKAGQGHRSVGLPALNGATGHGGGSSSQTKAPSRMGRGAGGRGGGAGGKGGRR